MSKARYYRQVLISKRIIFLNLLLVFLLLCVGCVTVPVTGRSQLMLIGKEEEEKIGEAAFYHFTKPLWDKGEIIKSDDSRPEMREHFLKLNRILGRIMNATDWDKEYKWKFVIVEEPKTINAGMYPGGKLVVYTGILNFAKSDDELAAVIGHEVAHAMARHGAERYSQITATNLTLAVIDAAVASSQKSSKYGGAIHVAFGLGAQLGVLLPYSRLHENEADYIGFLIMSKAGYDPRGAIQFWERMEIEHRTTQIEFLSTHPGYGTRISNLRQWLPQAMVYREDPTMPLPAKGEQVQASARKPATEVQSKSATQLCFEGRRLLEQEKYYEAITYFNKAIEKHPQYDEAYFRMGLCYGKLGRNQEAMEAFKEVIRIRPIVPEAHFYLGVAYGQLGRPYDAVEAFKETIRIKPDSAEAYCGLSTAFGILGRYQEAIDAAKESLRIRPDFAEGHRTLGNGYARFGHYEEALQVFEKAFLIKPNFPEAHNARGVTYSRMGRYDKAIEDYNRAIDLKPDIAVTYSNRGYVYIELQNYESAMKDFQKSIDINKNYVNPYIGLSIVCFRQKRINESKTYYQNAIEIEPSLRDGVDTLEKNKGYFFSESWKQTIKEIIETLVQEGKQR